MDYFWKENKRYLIAVGAAILFTLVFFLLVLGPLRRKADQAAAARLRAEQALRQRLEKGLPDEDTVGVARIDLRRTRDLLASLVSDMNFREADRYRKPENVTWVEHWNAEKMDVDRALKAQTATMVHTPKSFVSAVEDPGEEMARELLLRLAVVERLVRVAAEAKVERIDSVDMLPVSSAGARKEEPVTKKGVFLNKYSVQMAFKGDQQSVFRVLHAVQKKGPSFLAVENFAVDRRDPSKDLLDATLRVSLLRIDEKAPLEAREERAP